MKHLKLTFLLTALLSAVGANIYAHDIEVANADGVTIYYVWTNDKTELAVSYRESSPYSYSGRYSGAVTIPESVTYNGKTYPVTSIGDAAFYNCNGLTSVTIGNGVTSIGGSAFSGCSGLTSVTISSSVTSIGYDAFTGTSWYKKQPNGLVYAGKVAYRYKGAMPANTKIILEEGTLGIAGSAFEDCRGLTSVTIPNSVSHIGNSAFQDCSNLTSVMIPNSVTYISDQVFKRCSSLTSVTIGNSVTSIGSSAFSYCSSLTSVTCLAVTPPSLGSYAFDDYTVPLYVPKGSVIKYKAAENWQKFVIIREISEGQDIYLSIRQANGSVNLKVDAEKPYFNLQIKADDGWKIHSVTLGKGDVTAEVASDGSYTTPVISSNSVLSVVFEKGGTTGVVAQTESRLRVTAHGNTISVQGAEKGEQIAVYSMDGKLVEAAKTAHGYATITLPENQTYIVKGRQKTVKVRL